MKEAINIFWFRRDLRLNDNAGLFHALKDGIPVLPVFIFDSNILGQLDNCNDRRVQFIYNTIAALHRELGAMGATIKVFHDRPENVFQALPDRYHIAKVFTNHDYEPYARERDEAVRKILNHRQIPFHTYKDQVIFEKDEVVKDDGTPYVVFTPYSKRWLDKLDAHHPDSYPCKKYFSGFLQRKPAPLPSLKNIGFTPTREEFPPVVPDIHLISHYGEQRDFPAADGTSRMGIHLRFGTVSIRHLVALARKYSPVYLKELIWREFYMMILWHFPQVGRGRAFKKEYELIEWRNNEQEFGRWCEGKTGYPLVDAGMRQLNQTGFMHNRVRMVVASFLAKHLLIDWRWGEAYFAGRLLDYELASNNGGWQWAAGSGCDAAPYFRVFNPTLQARRFDPQFSYVQRWVPEWDGFGYPEPLVDHEFARKRCLEVYGRALKRRL